MIDLLPRPAICLIDDEKEDFEPMKAALLTKGIACIHIEGAEVEHIPLAPISGFRVVLLDLHLSNDASATAIARTANVFLKSVAIEDSPIIVVIWSKHASDVVESTDETEADHIQQRLKEELGPKFEQLVFKIMPKPNRSDRLEESQWVESLFNDLNAQLLDSRGIGLLWTWEGLASQAISSASTSIVELARKASAQDPSTFKLSVEALMRELAQKQGGPDCSNNTAVRHLVTTLSSLASDSLENGMMPETINAHGTWLSEKLSQDERKLVNPKALNGILLSAAADTVQSAFTPGMLYNITDLDELKSRFGYTIEQLTIDCFSGKGDLTSQSVKSKLQLFGQGTSCVALEITPACDFHQLNNRSASLLLGLCCKDTNVEKHANSKDSCKKTKTLEDRFTEGRPTVSFVFCAFYRFSLPLNETPSWLVPRMRLRDLVVTDFRNWASSQASKVGYLSV